MTAPTPHRRPFYPTPSWLVLGSLAVTGLLFLSERWRWFAFNEHKGWTVLIAVAGVGVVLLLMLLWWGIALIFRLRFQFSIRTLLVMVVAVALPFSWLAVEMKKAREERNAQQAIVAAGGSVYYDYEYDDVQDRIVGGRKPPMPDWLRSRLGLEFFADIMEAIIDDDQSISRLRELRKLRYVFIGRKDVGAATGGPALESGDDLISDVGLRYLEGLDQLEGVQLAGTNITDVGLEHLRGLANLRILEIYSNSITNEGLQHLGRLDTVTILRIVGSQITDKGLRHLNGMSQLRKLELFDSQVTDAGVKTLQRALPHCKITRQPPEPPPNPFSS